MNKQRKREEKKSIKRGGPNGKVQVNGSLPYLAHRLWLWLSWLSRVLSLGFQMLFALLPISF